MRGAGLRRGRDEETRAIPDTITHPVAEASKHCGHGSPYLVVVKQKRHEAAPDVRRCVMPAACEATCFARRGASWSPKDQVAMSRRISQINTYYYFMRAQEGIFLRDVNSLSIWSKE